MEVFQMRKLISVSVALIVAAGVMTTAPATAATKVSNGASCTKAGSISKFSGLTYKCAKNPLSSSTKLTWLLTACLDASALYLKNKALLPAIKTSSEARVAEIDIDLQKAQADLAELLASGPAKIAALEAKVTEAKAKQADAKAKQVALAADPVNQAKYKVIVQQWDLAIKQYGDAIADLGTEGKAKIERAINRLTIYKSSAKSQYVSVSADVTDALGLAKMICAKGL